MYLLLTLGAAFSYALGGVCMKSSAGMSRLGPTLLFYVLFGAGATQEALAMRKTELGVTYLTIVGMEAAVALGCGWWFFAEGLSWWKVVGVAAILTGIFLLHQDTGRPAESARDDLAAPPMLAAPVASETLL
jgi:multidrug transporter EmrE-like cation transporter